MAQPPQACAPCPAHYAVLQGAYARYTNTLIVLERALYLAHANARTLLVDTCNSAAAHKRCVVSEGGKRASVALAYNKPECSGL